VSLSLSLSLSVSSLSSSPFDQSITQARGNKTTHAHARTHRHIHWSAWLWGDSAHRRAKCVCVVVALPESVSMSVFSFVCVCVCVGGRSAGGLLQMATLCCAPTARPVRLPKGGPPASLGHERALPSRRHRRQPPSGQRTSGARKWCTHIQRGRLGSCCTMCSAGPKSSPSSSFGARPCGRCQGRKHGQPAETKKDRPSEWRME